ncbi:enoyl-CoA hydratase/isomerase family protein [Reichenbachiella carrageenanivorans]|uniref:Enoyl-CoA hydratase/isomerase family protein n=1 Tax=Reichenbachiella carrageenanivorans TaxID=2979869 RepID=A0ABY6CY74_9BACT|nr:enoyl-CoA hydratase/isomerase family protein [Reichenbachiella carrageenanivorans]UXX78867.1 enoyl-CoA hydratase/isomerase family protein [Reichenbachiella carrageenanivorans]
MNGTVNIEINQGIGSITFFHPQSNSLPSEILNLLADTITSAGQNEEVKVIILKSEGDRAFCAGASFDELIAIKDLETGTQFFSGFAKVINAARKCPKLIIGRVQGKAVGGGVGLASAVDYCMATQYASVKLSELAIGIGPFVVGPAVERKIGVSAMSQLAINATEWHSAQWAQSKGLYTEVYDNIEIMDEAIHALAQKLATSNPEAMRLLKQIFWEGTDHWDTLLTERAGMSGQLVLSAFTREAINSFKNK